jgi:hypothetical protein
VVRADRFGEPLEAGRRFAALDRVQDRSVPGEARQSLRIARRPLVRDVVRPAREAVDRLDRPPEGGWNEPRSDREVLVVIDRQVGRRA